MKRYAKRILFSLLALLIVALPLVSCGTRAEAMDQEMDYFYSSTANGKFDASPYPEASADEIGFGALTDSLSGSSASSGAANDSSDVAYPENTSGQKKKIKTAVVEAETKEFDQTLKALDDLLYEAAGEIESQSLQNRNYVSSGSYYGRSLELVIRVPADRFDAFLSEIGGVMNVLTSKSATQDISNTYYKIADVLETLETERTSLLNMMNSLETAKEYELWYKLETRLSELEQEIAVYRGQLARYDNQVDYSTLTLTLNEVTEYSPKITEITFGERIAEAFTRSWRNFADGVQDFCIFLVGALPTLLVLAVIGAVVVVILCAALRGRKKPADRKNDAQSDDSSQNNP